MHFLTVLTFVLYANSLIFFRALRREGRPSLLEHMHQFTGMIGAAAFILGSGVFDNPEKGIHPNAFNWCVPLFFACGLLSILLFTWKLIKLIREKSDESTLSWRSGISLMTILAGFYLCFTVVDHWWFFRNPEESQAGTAAAQRLGADDIKCDSMVLMRMEKDTARYRCPDNMVVYGKYINQPFAPWPSYREGFSVKLKTGVEDIWKKALPATEKK